MQYYVTTPFGDTRAKLNFQEPMDEPYIIFSTLPDGDGPIHLIDGELVRAPVAICIEPPDPLGELKAENKTLRAQVQALSDRNDFLEGCVVEIAGAVYP